MALLTRKFKIFFLILVAPILIGATLFCILLLRVQNEPVNISYLLPLTGFFIEEEINSKNLTVFWNKDSNWLLVESEQIALRNESYEVKLHDLATKFELDRLQNGNYLPSLVTLGSVDIHQSTKRGTQSKQYTAKDLEAETSKAIASLSDYIDKLPLGTETSLSIRQLSLTGMMEADFAAKSIQASIRKDHSSLESALAGEIGFNNEFVKFELQVSGTTPDKLAISYKASGITPTTINYLAASSIDLSWLQLDASIEIKSIVDLGASSIDQLDLTAYLNNIIFGQNQKSTGIQFSKIPITIQCRDSFREITVVPFTASSQSVDLALEQFEILTDDALTAVGTFAISNLGISEFTDILQGSSIPLIIAEDPEFPLQILKSTFDFEIGISKPPAFGIEGIKVDSNFIFKSGEQQFELQLITNFTALSNEMTHSIILPRVNPSEIAGFIPESIKAYIPDAEIKTLLTATTSRDGSILKQVELAFESKEGSYKLPIGNEAFTIKSSNFQLSYDASQQRIDSFDVRIELPYGDAHITNGIVDFSFEDRAQDLLPIEFSGVLTLNDLDYKQFTSDFPQYAAYIKKPLRNIVESLHKNKTEIELNSKIQIPLTKDRSVKVDSLTAKYSTLFEAYPKGRFKTTGQLNFDATNGGQVTSQLSIKDASPDWLPSLLGDYQYKGDATISTRTSFDRHAQALSTQIDLEQLNLHINSPTPLYEDTVFTDNLHASGSAAYDWFNQSLETTLDLSTDYLENITIQSTSLKHEDSFEIELRSSGEAQLESLAKAYTTLKLPDLEQTFSGKTNWDVAGQLKFTPKEAIDLSNLSINGSLSLNNFDSISTKRKDRLQSKHSKILFSNVDGTSNLKWQGTLDYTTSAERVFSLDASSAEIQSFKFNQTAPIDFKVQLSPSAQTLAQSPLGQLIDITQATIISANGTVENANELQRIQLAVDSFSINNNTDYLHGAASYAAASKTAELQIDSFSLNEIEGELHLISGIEKIEASVAIKELDIQNLIEIKSKLPSAAASQDSVPPVEKSLEVLKKERKSLNLACTIDHLSNHSQTLASSLSMDLAANNDLSLESLNLAGTLNNGKRFSLNSEGHGPNSLSAQFEINDLITTVQATSDIVASVSNSNPFSRKQIPFTGGAIKGITELTASRDTMDLFISSITIEDLYIVEPPFFLKLFSKKINQEETVQAGHSIQLIQMDAINVSTSGISIKQIDMHGEFSLTISDLNYSTLHNTISGRGNFSKLLGIEFEGPIDNIQFYLEENAVNRSFLRQLSNEEALLF